MGKMALPTHERVIERLLERYKNQTNTVAITLFGSFAKGNAHSGSDIDMEVISNAVSEWKLVKEKVDGIAVDIVFISKEDLENQVKNYPYLSYDYISGTVLHGPEGFFAKIQTSLSDYFDDHPEVGIFWQENLNVMRDKKNAGTHKMKDVVETYDEAERRFSTDGKVTRTFLRG